MIFTWVLFAVLSGGVMGFILNGLFSVNVKDEYEFMLHVEKSTNEALNKAIKELEQRKDVNDINVGNIEQEENQ